MNKYLVTFHKSVPDEAGHERRVPQRQAVVCAGTEAIALREAQTIICQTEGVADWRVLANGCEVAEMADVA